MKDHAQQLAPQELSTAIDRFLTVNEQRLERIRSSLSSKQGHFLDVLPILFQINHPDLPGFVSRDTPCGIYSFNQKENSKKIAKQLFRLLDKDFYIPSVLNIEAIYLMGSSGTIAYNEKSDFDIWVLHEDDLSDEQIDELISKTVKIEQWCQSLGLEVHFFVFSAQQFRRGDLHSISNESSGQTQFYLLLDEFYRSSVLISGKKPAWWLIPPGSEEKKYNDKLNTLFVKNEIDINDYIDFGNLSNAPVNEFFTASIWQLYKSIHSPYKSLLKLLLIERYAREYPNINFLSQRYKKEIYAGNTDIYDIDPYLMLYYKLEEFLLNINQGKLLELVRKCLYLKVNEKLSSPLLSNARWRYFTMKKVTQRWGWNTNDFKHMDNIDNWRLEDVLNIRQRLVNALVTSYQFLSDFARENNEKISFEKNELNILGRRLFSAFDRKNNKIDLINHNIAPNIFEDKVSLLDIKSSDKELQWLLYRDTVKPENINKHTVLKQNKFLMELVCWLYFNDIVRYESRVLITNRYHDIDIINLQKVLQSLSEVFPRKKNNHQKNDLFNFNQAQKLKQSAIYINIALPSTNKVIDDNKFLSSSRDDVLSYGGRHKNMIESLDLVIETSWEEVLYYRHTNNNGIAQCICDYLNWFPRNENTTPPLPPVFCYLSHYNKVIVKRFELLFGSLIEAFYTSPIEINMRYVFEIENQYIVIVNEENRYSYKLLSNYENLKNYLMESCVYFTQTVFDKKSFWPDNLHTIYHYNKPDSIQVFYVANNKVAEIFILDEKGSYFTQQVEFLNRDLLIHHYNVFINNTLKRRKFLLSHELNHKNDYALEFYNIHYKHNKEYVFNKCKQFYGKHDRFYFPVQVIGKIDEHEKHSLSIFCRDIEFSTDKHGKDIFKKSAEHIFQHRKEKEKYPMYITDIDVLENMFNKSKHMIQTIDFLNYKKHIENQLNLHLSEIT